MKCIMELVKAVGELALEEGEKWRLDHTELMDAYEAMLDEIAREERKFKY